MCVFLKTLLLSADDLVFFDAFGIRGEAILLLGVESFDKTSLEIGEDIDDDDVAQIREEIEIGEAFQEDDISKGSASRDFVRICTTRVLILGVFPRSVVVVVAFRRRCGGRLCRRRFRRCCSDSSEG